MTTHINVEREETIFKKRLSRGQARTLVRQSVVQLPQTEDLRSISRGRRCREDAERFREGAEFELRKLLDCELPELSSGEFRVPQPNIG